MNASLEQEVRTFLIETGYTFEDNCGSLVVPDFLIKRQDGSLRFYLEVKEKIQAINLRNWPNAPRSIPEQSLFILDELSARKLWYVKDAAGLLIKLRDTQKYYFLNALEVWLIPRVRVNRQIADSLKGKWIIDLRQAHSCQGLQEVFEKSKIFAERFTATILQSQCYDFLGRVKLPINGIKRTEEHIKVDFSKTR